MVGKKARIVLTVSAVFAVLLAISFIYFALAAHVLTPADYVSNPTGYAFSFTEDNVNSTVNVTITNTNSGANANITQVNFTVPGTFTLVRDANGTTATFFPC